MKKGEDIMGNYWDSFDCEVQCEEIYLDEE